MKKKQASDLTVTFNDGEVKTYRISAGPGIARYLAMEAGQSGVLTLWNGEQSYGIPIASIRDWSIVGVDVPDAEDITIGGNDETTTGADDNA